MAVLPGDIKIFNSVNGLGGAITNNEIVSSVLHNVFDEVSKSESETGSTEYRCIYIKNTNTTDVFSAVEVYLKTQTDSPTTSLSFGLGTAAVGGTEQSIANETTAPLGVSFITNIGEANSQSIGDIPAQSYKAIWLRRIIEPNTSSASLDSATLTFDGSTI